MSAKIVLCVLLALVCVVSAQTETKLIIDDFSVITGPLFIVVDASELPESVSTSTLTNGAIGGERDLQLTVLQGDNNLLTNSGVTGNNWNVANSDGITGNSFLQYDGPDDSATLVSDGLGGVDLTIDDGDRFRLLIESDLATIYVITIHDMQGRTSEREISIPGTDTTEEYLVPFSDFVGSADFSDIGAIQILVETFEDVDPILSVFAVIGPVGSDPSPSPTPSPGAPPPPPPPPPAASASPTPVPQVFTWYTFDDDDNGRSPCGDEEPRRTYFVSDEDVIYYYFFGFNDSNNFLSSSSSASTLAVGFGMIIASVVALIF